MYILRGQYDAALQQLEGAKTAGNSPAEVENLKGLALLLSGQTARAVASFDAALLTNASLAEARFNRGVALLQLRDYTRASAELETIWKTADSPLRASAAYHNAVALDRLDRGAEAETWLTRALTADPKLDAALLLLGFIRERRGALQEAGRAYLDYLKRNPESRVAKLRFGISAHQAGKVDVATAYLRQVISAAPDSAEAMEARKFLVMWE